MIYLMGNETKNIINVTADTWDNDVLGSETPVLIAWWGGGASWLCVEPTLAELSETMNGKVKIVEIDVNKDQKMAMQYGIKSIPTLLLFNKGQEIGRTVGAESKETYQQFIEQIYMK